MRALKLSRGLETIVDDADFDWLSQWKWCANVFSGSPYALRNVSRAGKTKTLLLHRIITDAPVGMVVDHINRNTLDNTRANLRVCTQMQNCWNASANARKKSALPKGVFLEKRTGKFFAHICANKTVRHLGTFDTIEKAATAYAEAAATFHGSFARLA